MKTNWLAAPPSLIGSSTATGRGAGPSYARPMRLAALGLVAIVVGALGLACGSSSGKVAGYIYCSRDSDCPAGQVCDEDDTKDSYCTPGCTTDDECPTQVSCPSLSPVGKKCWMEPQLEATARGVCDQFQGLFRSELVPGRTVVGRRRRRERPGVHEQQSVQREVLLRLLRVLEQLVQLRLRGCRRLCVLSSGLARPSSVGIGTRGDGSTGTTGSDALGHRPRRQHFSRPRPFQDGTGRRERWLG